MQLMRTCYILLFFLFSHSFAVKSSKPMVTSSGRQIKKPERLIEQKIPKKTKKHTAPISLTYANILQEIDKTREQLIKEKDSLNHMEVISEDFAAAEDLKKKIEMLKKRWDEIDNPFDNSWRISSDLKKSNADLIGALIDQKQQDVDQKIISFNRLILDNLPNLSAQNDKIEEINEIQEEIGSLEKAKKVYQDVDDKTQWAQAWQHLCKMNFIAAKISGKNTITSQTKIPGISGPRVIKTKIK